MTTRAARARSFRRTASTKAVTLKRRATGSLSLLPVAALPFATVGEFFALRALPEPYAASGRAACSFGSEAGRLKRGGDYALLVCGVASVSRDLIACVVSERRFCWNSLTHCVTVATISRAVS